MHDHVLLVTFSTLERSAVKNSFSTYVCYAPEGLFWLNLCLAYIRCAHGHFFAFAWLRLAHKGFNRGLLMVLLITPYLTTKIYILTISKKHLFYRYLGNDSLFIVIGYFGIFIRTSILECPFKKLHFMSRHYKDLFLMIIFSLIKMICHMSFILHAMF